MTDAAEQDRPVGRFAPLCGFDWSRPLVMGILNVTPDSFSDGGRFANPQAAVNAGKALVAQGADILDIGGESTRPGADPVPEAEELDRVLPVIEALADTVPVPLSIDTRKARVMREAIAAGAEMINDVSALTHDPDSLAVAAEADVPVVLMHAQGDPQTMQDAPHYDDVVTDVTKALQARVEACIGAGLARDRLILDPGIGFGKTLEHNLALLAGLDRIVALGAPVLLGVSRKSFIRRLDAQAETADARLGGSLAAALAGVARGAHMVRVHDVRETVQGLAVWRAISATGGGDD